MGATNVLYEATGSDYRKAFNALWHEAERQFGSDPYNGSISTMSLSGRPTKIAVKYSDAAEKKARAHIEKDDWGEKRVAQCLDLGVIGYEVSRFEKVPHTKAEAIYETYFIAYADDRELGAFKKAADARACAEKALLTCPNAERIYVEKTSRPKEKYASTTAAEWRRVTRTSKSKPKKIAKGATVSEIHRFWFYGWAAI